MNILKQKDIPTQIDWTPGQSVIVGNEIADHLAKEAAKEAETFTDDRKFTSIADAKMASKKYVISLWQKRWDNSETGRTYHSYFPRVDRQHNKNSIQPDTPASNRLLTAE